MGKPRFKPARVCSRPREFARAQHPIWADPCPLDEVEAAWAIFQHRAAFAVLEEIAARGESIAELAEHLGEDPAWLQRKLYGQTPATIGDVMSWALLLGVQVLPVFDAHSEMKPTRS